MKEFWTVVLGYNKYRIMKVFFLYIFLSVFVVLLPYENGKVVDALVRQVSLSSIYQSIIIFGGILLGRVAFSYLYTVKCRQLVQYVTMKMRLEVLKHLQHIPLLKFQSYDVLYLSDRIRRDVAEVAHYAVVNYCHFFLNGFLFLAYCLFIGSMNSKICLYLSLIVPIYLAVYIFSHKILFEYAIKLREREYTNNKNLDEQMLLMEEIKLAGNYENHRNYIWQGFSAYLKICDYYFKLEGRFMHFEELLSALFQVALFFYGAYSIIQGHMSIGDLVIILGYFQAMLSIISFYITFAKDFPRAQGAYGRIREIMDIALEPQGDCLPQNISKLEAAVSFSYKEDVQLLCKEYFSGECNNIYGLTGSNGVGKTTFLKLLTGVIPFADGYIHYAGVEQSSMNMDAFKRDRVGYLSQKHAMTNKSVQGIFQEFWPNMEEKSLDKLFSFLSVGQRSKIVAMLQRLWRKNYQELSEGQKQMVAFLRVLGKKPSVMLLDEPTSNLDATRRVWLNEILQEIKENSLVITVSHDKDFLALCDEVKTF